jgi:hypothetical protein
MANLILQARGQTRALCGPVTAASSSYRSTLGNVIKLFGSLILLPAFFCGTFTLSVVHEAAIVTQRPLLVKTARNGWDWES